MASYIRPQRAAPQTQSSIIVGRNGHAGLKGLKLI
jgi:hypothetical protein